MEGDGESKGLGDQVEVRVEADTQQTGEINRNPVLTLITTEDGITSTTNVTVLTTTGIDVPLGATIIETVPILTSHDIPTFVASSNQPGEGESISHSDDVAQVHTVVVGETGEISFMEGGGGDDNNAQQIFMVHAPDDETPTTTTSTSQTLTFTIGKTAASATVEEGKANRVSAVTKSPEESAKDESAAKDGDPPGSKQDDGSGSVQIVDGAKQASESCHPRKTKQDSAHKVNDEIIAGRSDPIKEEKSDQHASLGDGSVVVAPTITKNSEIVEVRNTPHVSIEPDKVICLVCYQTFPNPRKKEIEDTNKDEDKLKQKNISRNEPYGRSLANFFEVSRLNMSMGTRRSYKDYEVPICISCNEHLVQAETMIRELMQLEKDLYQVRQKIKEQIISSNDFYNDEDHRELVEERKNILGLNAMMETLDRIREDIIHDGRPPKRPKLLVGRRGRKLKTGATAEEKHESNSEKANSSQSVLANPDLENASTSGYELQEENDVKPAVRTSFGRVVKRPAAFMMMNDLSNDDLSDLGESSDENYEEIVIKPELPLNVEGENVTTETVPVNEENDDEDPVWAPPEEPSTMITAERLDTVSEESEEMSDYDSDAELTSKGKGKQRKRLKYRKPRKQSKKQGIRRRNKFNMEDMNYEVKVIQLDGTEIRTYSAVGAQDNIGLEPEITKKVLESQAVIMVKNQLFGKRVQCPHCPRSFTDPARCEVHIQKTHEGNTRPYACGVCHRRFLRQDHLKNHMKRHVQPSKEKPKVRPKPSASSQKKHTCEYCDLRFRNKSELSIHTRLHTGERPFKCETCDDAFVSALKREFHIEQMHPEIPPIRCEFCPKGFFRAHRLRIHAVCHTGEKPNICEICGKCFSQAAMLRYHQTTHEELKMKQFKCHECNRVFANPQNLKSHTESQHQKMYRHRCEQCGRGYTQMSHLRRHLRTHSGEQPFTCSYCPKKFTSGAALKIHARIHTGERPYWCNQCEKGFRSKTKLGRHMKTLIHTSGESNKVIKKEEEENLTEIETMEVSDVNPASTATWTEIVGIITGV